MSVDALEHFRALITESFTLVAVDVFKQVQTLVKSYEDENKRLRSLLNSVLQPEVRLPKIEYPELMPQSQEAPDEVKDEQMECVIGDDFNITVKSEPEETNIDNTSRLTMLKVQYQSTNKYIQLQAGFNYKGFMEEVKSKFGLSDSAELVLTDVSDTEIEEDVFEELIQVYPDINLKIQECPLRKSASMPVVLFSSSSRDVPSPSCQSESEGLTDWFQPPATDMNTKTDKRKQKVTRALNGEVLDSTAARQLVLNALQRNPSGEDILLEYKSHKSLCSRSRRQLVNIVISDMTQRHGRMLVHKQKESYALGIITLFPSLKDPFSPKGYEHFYDATRNTGYFSWRLKTIGRNRFKPRVKNVLQTPQEQGPQRRRVIPTSAGEQLQGDACNEAIASLRHCSDVTDVLQIMKSTLHYRQEFVHNEQNTSDILNIFPCFLDVKGLVNQDFTLLFGFETSSRLMKRWHTVFKPKIIHEAKLLTKTTDLHQLLTAAEEDEYNDNSWDSDMASVLLLLHLLPPSAGGKQNKISSTDAEKKLVYFHESGHSLQKHLREKDAPQPYIIAVGQTRNRPDAFYIAVNKQLIPCQAASSLGAFDDLFKAHFVFNAAYDLSLVQFFRFIQTTIFNIDIETTTESPRLRELRAKFLNGS